MLKSQSGKLKLIFLFVFIFIIISALATGTKTLSSSLFGNLDFLTDNSTLKFAHVSDVHLDFSSKNSRQRLYENSDELLLDAISQINEVNGIDFVVFSGDSVNGPSKNDFIKLVETLNYLRYPWYLSTGNHEIGIRGGLSKQSRVDIIDKYGNLKINKSYYHFIPKKGYIIIVMDGVIDTKNTAHGYFSREQLDWLDKQLDSNRNSKAIIVQHFPLVQPFDSGTHFILNSREYQQVLDKHNNVIMLLSGHYHASKITKVGNIIHVSTPALIEYPNAFRVITVTDKNNRIKIDFEFKETRLKNLQQESESKSGSWKLHYGEPGSRNTTLIINK